VFFEIKEFAHLKNAAKFENIDKKESFKN